MPTGTTPEIYPSLQELGYNPDTTNALASGLSRLNRLPQYVRGSTPPSMETPYQSALAMVRTIISNQNLIHQHWPQELTPPPLNLIRWLSAATLLSDIGKAGESDDPLHQVVPRIYLEIFQMNNSQRLKPIAIALEEYRQEMIADGCDSETAAEAFAPLSKEEIAYLRHDDLLGPDFDPTNMTAGEIFTKLHLRVAQKLFRQLGIQDQPEVIVALSHHFDQGEYPENLSTPPDSTTLNLIAFVSLFDKLHASINRGGNQPLEAIEKVTAQVTNNFQDKHPGYADQLLNIYSHWLDFFKKNSESFFPDR